MQRWIYEQGWTVLYDAQERAIRPILNGGRDVIIAAATAAGKTEATFLPILSTLISDVDRTTSAHRDRDLLTAHEDRDLQSVHHLWKPRSAQVSRARDHRADRYQWVSPEPQPAVGVQVLYLSPLKALINDQCDRLKQLSKRANIAVHSWHGDVSSPVKQQVLADPSGILLITPESLEAVFVNRGTLIPSLFAGLRHIVIDELHSFIATPRGAQVQSLLNRVGLAIRRHPQRIGLSATLADMGKAAEFIRPAHPQDVVVIESKAEGRELLLRLRGYTESSTPDAGALINTPDAEARINTPDSNEDVTPAEEDDTGFCEAIADHLFRHLRGQDNLVFANSRTQVEAYADELTRRSARERVPNEFSPHHGNLSKRIRESIEARLKDTALPTTAVCTSTLELGIDIGSVVSIAQIGPPPSVASLRQRLGRSGRRHTDPSVLRVHIAEQRIGGGSGLLNGLRCDTVQTIAMVRLMLDRWLEDPDDPGFNYSTLIQQIMSVIAQHGGATAVDMHRALCGPGPFHLVDQTRFVRLLRAMAAADLLTQASDGLLLHGAAGERRVNHYSFYTAFKTHDEWRLVADGKTIGTVTVNQPLHEDMLMIFAGKRWRVTRVDEAARVVDVVRSSGGTPPNFAGGFGAAVADRIRAEMLAVYSSSDVPIWLDPEARRLLAQGRDEFARLGLGATTVIHDGTEILLLPWSGDRAMFTAAMALRREGIKADTEGPAIRISRIGVGEVAWMVRHLLGCTPPRADELAAVIKNRGIDKWDWVLDDTLACESAGAKLLDIDGGWELLAKVERDLMRESSAAEENPELHREEFRFTQRLKSLRPESADLLW